MNIDVTYGEYFGVFSGGEDGLIPTEKFDGYIKRAKIFLKSICTDATDESYIEDIKNCLCALAEEIYSQQKQGGIKTENIDGYSVTYSMESPAERRLLRIALTYLGKSGLLYAGVE